MKSDTNQFREMCFSCCRPKKACFCNNLTPFSTHSRFILLMHPKEAKLSHIGTGRLAKGALKNSEIIIGENFDKNARVQSYLEDDKYFPFVLYPGENAIDISKEKPSTEILKGRIPLIFIIDGTWPCAKSMFRDSKTLHKIPRISFSHDQRSRYVIRHQPANFCLSTIESIYLLVKNLERIEWENVGVKKECLLKALDELCAFQIKCAEDPDLQRYSRKRGSYKKPSERVSSKRWDHRKICFEDRHYKDQRDYS